MLPQKFSAAATMITRPSWLTCVLAVLHAVAANATDNNRQPARTSHAGRTDNAGNPPVAARGRMPDMPVIPFGYIENRFHYNLALASVGRWVSRQVSAHAHPSKPGDRPSRSAIADQKREHCS